MGSCFIRKRERGKNLFAPFSFDTMTIDCLVSCVHLLVDKGSAARICQTVYSLVRYSRRILPSNSRRLSILVRLFRSHYRLDCLELQTEPVHRILVCLLQAVREWLCEPYRNRRRMRCLFSSRHVGVPLWNSCSGCLSIILS